jgi:uncharacterized membrane protein
MEHANETEQHMLEREEAELQAGVTQNDPLNESIETIADLHLRMEGKVGPHQRAIERVTAALGRPRFLYVILLFVSIWVLINGIGMRSGLPPFDSPPFYWLQGTISLSSLLMTTIVLITQNRQNKATQQQRQLDLHVNLLVEQKVSKVISLLEELRRDSSVIGDRHDPQAEALQSSVDPHEALASLDNLLQENAKKEPQERL